MVGEKGAMTGTNLMLQIFGYAGSGIKESGGKGDMLDETTLGIGRARRCIIVGQNEEDGLPVVAPTQDGRIVFTEEHCGDISYAMREVTSFCSTIRRLTPYNFLRRYHPSVSSVL